MAASLRVLPTRWRRGRFAYKMAAMQDKQNVNKNNVEYILRLHLVKVTWPLHGHPGWHYNDSTGRPPTRSAFDNAQRHVTAFRPISEAARSWPCDNWWCCWWRWCCRRCRGRVGDGRARAPVRMWADASRTTDRRVHRQLRVAAGRARLPAGAVADARAAIQHHRTSTHTHTHATSGVGTMGTWGYIVPPSSGLVSPVLPKSKMRLMSKF